MKIFKIVPSLSIAILLLAAGARAEDTAEAHLQLLPEGATAKLGFYAPHRLQLSADMPADLKKSPEMTAPLYGTVSFGGKSYLLAVDETDDKDHVMYVDIKGTGELTAESAVKWERQPNGVHAGAFKLPLPSAKGSTPVQIKAYRFDRKDPRRAALKSTLLIYSDYAMDGEISLNGSKFHAMMIDRDVRGDFRPMADAAIPAVQLLIDVSGDGKFNGPGKMFDAAKPFNIKGTTWKLTNVTEDGSFKIEKSAEAVAEILPPPNLSAGAAAIAFTAQAMDGSDVTFPADYKGKLVLLDFWATWCGPCMQEVPGLVATYEKLHPKGLEVLGVTLDQENAAARVKTVTGDKKMTWKQVYDGKFWNARVAKMYGIQSIPHAYLVDGDTGKIVAEGTALRGENLAKTIETALAEKAKGDTKGK